jgi:hypothetical protein
MEQCCGSGSRSGIRRFFDPRIRDSEWVKKIRIRIRDETVFWVKILKFFDADLRWKKFGSEKKKSRIRNLKRRNMY